MKKRIIIAGLSIGITALGIGLSIHGEKERKELYYTCGFRDGLNFSGRVRDGEFKNFEDARKAADKIKDRFMSAE